jgi:chloramphenicol-sensitive protein RarD
VTKGVLASVTGSVLYAALFYYASLLHPLNGEEVFGWRMLFNAPFLTVLVLASGQWQLVRSQARRLRARPILIPGVICCATLVAIQLWLFVWAPINGRALDASLGFFLMPLSIALIGRVVFGDRLSRPQAVAAMLAVVGVANELIRVGGISGVTLFIAVGYPTYYALRRTLRTDDQGGVWIEMHLVLPVAVLLVLGGEHGLGALADRPALIAMVPGLGLISAVAVTGHYLSSRLLPFGLFGLLIYLEPVLLVLVALLLGERIASDQWLTYIPIWAALVVLFGEGAWSVVPRLRRARQAVA